MTSQSPGVAFPPQQDAGQGAQAAAGGQAMAAAAAQWAANGSGAPAAAPGGHYDANSAAFAQQMLQPGQQQQLNQLMQQQQQQQILQNPTLNMMLQGMQQAAAGMPGGMATMQSPGSGAPPNSTNFVLLPQGTRMDPSRDLNPSPNATPGLQQQHPGPTQTPPNLGGIDFTSDRSWSLGQQQQQQQNLFMGPRMLDNKSLIEEQMKQQQQLETMFGGGGAGLDPTTAAFSAAAAGASQSERAVAAQLAAQQDMAARMNQFAAAAQINPAAAHPFAAAQQMAAAVAAAQGQPPQMHQHPPHSAAFMAPPQTAQSPPGGMGQGGQLLPPHHQMPPRPRPEGGQDPPHSFLSEQNDGQKKQDLVIDSWSNEDAAKLTGRTGGRQDDAGKGEDGTGGFGGWGGPPPAHPSGWGVNSRQPNQGGLTPQQQQQHQQPPPTWQQPPSQFDGGVVPQQFGGGGRGGYGGGRGGYRSQFDGSISQFDGGFRGGRGGRGGGRGGAMDRGGRGGYAGRGRGGYGRGGGNPADHSQEKQDGKKSAIAETMAMMSKMRMEDKEKREEHTKKMEARRKEMDEHRDEFAPDEPEPEVLPDERRGYRGRGGMRGGGRGGRGQWDGGRGGGMGMVAGGPINMLPGGPVGLGAMAQQMPPNGGLPFMPPPNAAAAAAAVAAGGIPPFPGLDGFLPPGVSPFAGPNPFGPGGPAPYGPGFAYPIPPGQFGMAGRGFPRGRGGFPMGFPPRGYQRGGPAMGMGGGFPRGGRGRGGRGGRGDRHGDGGRDLDDHQGDEDKGAADLNGEDCNNEVVEAPVPEGSIETFSPEAVAAEAAVGMPQQQQELPGGGAADGQDESSEQPKNLFSGQGVKKGRLALFAKSSPLPDHLDLRERLTQQLVDGTLECIICLDKIKPPHATWPCPTCYQVFHIHCIKKWSKTNRTEEGRIRCPAGCGYVLERAPKDYRCFCGKARDPEWNRRDTPHSCAEVCGRRRQRCDHKCTDLCHPGPCSDCQANIKISCPCGRTSRFARCGTEVLCDSVCGKVLNCGAHTCARKCHQDDCGDCEVSIEQKCYCGKTTREIACTKDTAGVEWHTCEATSCDKLLACGNHRCGQGCHPGECPPCKLTPDVVERCPCGQTELEKLYERDGVDPRASCLDPVPTCGKPCGKPLQCGPTGERHRCAALCHREEECPACPLTTEVRCRCGFMDREVECRDLKTRADDARCDKRCNRKRSCGRHKCGQPCCIEVEHPCPLICQKLLPCGKHRCEEVCHSGKCPTCPHVSFEELFCHCGEQVIYPPVHCGVRPPPCSNPCTRARPCGHPVAHTCHPDDEKCTPCTVLTEKFCYGGHEKRKSVFCHVEGLSCGRPCGKDLPCGRHTCDRACHEGPCGEACKQKCKRPREDSCGHPCASPCHDGECPALACKEKVTVKCACGNLKAVKLCGDQAAEYSRRHMSLMAAQVASSAAGGSCVDLATLNKISSKASALDCNEECARLERNRRLALALQVENPNDRTAAPNYTEFLRDFAKKDPVFAQKVHNKLSELVKLAKESKQKSRQHSFEVMNRDKRQFVHEYSDHFGVETESFDSEPKRNVVATAYRDRVWLPTQTLLDVVNKQRKLPAPVASLKSSESCGARLSSLGSTNAWASRTKEKAATPVVDYFNDG